MLKNKFILTVLLINLVLIISYFLLWFFVCRSGSCSYELRNAFLDPLATYLIGLSFSLIVLVNASKVMLRNWLVYIVSWYVPLSIFFISQIDVYSSSILAIDRSRAAMWWMGGLLLITVVYLLVQKFVLKKV